MQRLSAWATILLTGITLAVACGDSSSSSTSSPGSDAGADADTCCTPDPAPGCCMVYGGLASKGGCAKTCDGMPQPGDPGWSLTKNADGCMVWTNPKPNGGAGTCGSASNTSTLDPLCPKTLGEVRSICLSGHAGSDPCPRLGLFCHYDDSSDAGTSSMELTCAASTEDAGALVWECAFPR